MKSRTTMAMLAFSLAACSGGDEEATQGESVQTAPQTPLSPEVESRLPEETETIPPELRQQAEAASKAMRWHYKPGWALFGPPESEGVLTLRCASDEGRLHVTRMASRDIEMGARQMLRFRGDRGGATVDLTARESEFGPGLWEGSPDAPDILAALFQDGGTDIVATLRGDPPLALPANPEIAAFIRNCDA